MGIADGVNGWQAFALVVLALVPGGETLARADVSRAECVKANTDAQDARRDGKFSLAREKLRRCTDSSCPGMVRGDCTLRLDELEKAQPTIVFEVKDAAGKDVPGNVSVTVDGMPLASALEGKALPVDPGRHVFAFAVPGQAVVEQTFMVTEGVKGRRERIVLGAAPAPPRPDTPPPPLEAPPPAPAARPAASGSPLRAVGWVTGAVGVAGLGAGAIFGFMAIQDHNKADCNASRVCLTGPLNDANNAATLSTVGFVAGGMLAAAGIGLVILAPAGGGGEGRPTVTAVLSPVLAAGGAGLGVGGTW